VFLLVVLAHHSTVFLLVVLAYHSKVFLLVVLAHRSHPPPSTSLSRGFALPAFPACRTLSRASSIFFLGGVAVAQEEEALNFEDFVFRVVPMLR
jgi:hypothetical protein